MQQDIGPQIDQGAAAAMKDTGFQRSPAWERVAGTFLDQNQNNTCAACNKDKTQAKLEVHHMLPFHLCRLSQRPDLEFNPANLMTLCDVHHLYIGHLGDWQSFNETVRLDVKDVTRNPAWATLLDKLAFEQDQVWTQAEAGRPKSYVDWDPQFHQHFTDLITQWYGAMPQASLSQMIFQWYGLKLSESEITGAINTDAGADTSP